MNKLLDSLEPYNDVIGETDRSFIAKLWENQRKIAKAFDKHVHFSGDTDVRTGIPVFSDPSAKTLLEAADDYVKFITQKGCMYSIEGKALKDAVEREQAKQGADSSRHG